MDSRIQDIAAAAGVSIATVSRVFSRHPNVKPAVREKVIAAAGKAGYRPRQTQRKRNVVLITPSRSAEPFYIYTEMVLSHMSKALAEHKFRIEILPDDSLDLLRQAQFCGAVLIATGNRTLPKEWAEKFDAPLIDVNGGSERLDNVYAVSSDEAQGMDLAVGHLAAHGRRRIGALIHGAGARIEGGRDILRERGLKAAFKRHGTELDDAMIRYSEERTFMETVGKLLQAKPDAIICTGERTGNLLAYALNLFGKRIPDEISVVAYERMMVSDCCIPPQTTISQDFAEIAEQAVGIIERRLDGLPIPKGAPIPYKLIERDSVKSV